MLSSSAFKFQLPEDRLLFEKISFFILKHIKSEQLGQRLSTFTMRLGFFFG